MNQLSSELSQLSLDEIKTSFQINNKSNDNNGLVYEMIFGHQEMAGIFLTDIGIDTQTALLKTILSEYRVLGKGNNTFTTLVCGDIVIEKSVGDDQQIAKRKRYLTSIDYRVKPELDVKISAVILTPVQPRHLRVNTKFQVSQEKYVILVGNRQVVVEVNKVFRQLDELTCYGLRVFSQQLDPVCRLIKNVKNAHVKIPS